LADFAKLVELFDHHGVSFVSVTQQFNTTTSMGRLTLNVLLSFAQFEREVTSERIRDKIAASKRKGLWVGGMAPFGYDTKDRKITVNDAEADRVRTIFRSYLKLGSLNLLMVDLRNRNIVTKVRTLKTGQTVGGIPFTRGPLAYLLRNRFYVGKVVFKGETLAGEQPVIVDQDLFDAVQAKLNEQINNHRVSRTKSEALLLGRIYDDRGHRMTPSHVRKRGIKYRYYISSALLQGQRSRNVIKVPWHMTPSTRHREVLVPEAGPPQDARPIRSENRAILVASIARGRRWLDELIADPTGDTESIAGREGCSVRKVNMTISLAFLAPDLVKAAIDGRLPHGMGVARLRDLPAEWSRQRQMLELAAPVLRRKICAQATLPDR
jgi:hypothetical protein